MSSSVSASIIKRLQWILLHNGFVAQHYRGPDLLPGGNKVVVSLGHERFQTVLKCGVYKFASFILTFIIIDHIPNLSSSTSVRFRGE